MMADFRQGYQEFELGNGLKVALQRTPTKTIAGRLKVDFGSGHELPGEEGLAHFLEHVLPSGGSEKFSPEQQDATYRRFGYFNAQTGKEFTQFPVDMLPEDLRLYLEFVSDFAFRPGLDPRKVDMERGRIMREISDREGSTSKDMDDYTKAYFRNEFYEITTLGKELVVRAATPEDLRRMHSRGYGASNMNLILVGDLPPDAEDSVRKFFEGEPPGERLELVYPAIQPLDESVVLHRSAPDIINRQNPLESNSVVSITMFGPNINHRDSYAFRVMTNILGNGPGCRLFRRISEGAQLAYGIGASYSLFDSYGGLNIQGNVTASRQEEAIDMIFDEMARLREEPVDPRELDKEKRDAIYGIAKKLETNDGHIYSIERWLDRKETPEDFIQKMSTVTAEDVREVARRYLPASRASPGYVMLIRDPLLAA